MVGLILHVSRPLSVVGCQLSVVRCQLSAASCIISPKGTCTYNRVLHCCNLARQRASHHTTDNGRFQKQMAEDRTTDNRRRTTDALVKPAVVLLSGGLDSATALAVARSEGYAAYALSFRYGQRHAV